MKTLKKPYNMLIRSKRCVSQEWLLGTLSLIFVKVSPSKVKVFEWSHGRLKRDPVVSLYKSYTVLHRWPHCGDPLYWKIASLMKIKFKTLHTFGFRLVTFSDGSRAVFFPGMKITYGGKPVRPYPKKWQCETREALDTMRLEKNRRQRLYHKRHYPYLAAARRFEAAAEYESGQKTRVNEQPIRVDVEKLPLTDVFKLRNVSHRRILIDYYGLDAILATLDSKVLDSEVINGNSYQLVMVSSPYYNSPLGNGMVGTYLRMINPSTGETHFEGVPNYRSTRPRVAHPRAFPLTSRGGLSSQTVRGALAWRDGEDEYTVPVQLT